MVFIELRRDVVGRTGASSGDNRVESTLHVGAIRRSTLRLSAFGAGVLDSHQTQLTASLTRIRRTVTHSAGEGSLAGLYQ